MIKYLYLFLGLIFTSSFTEAQQVKIGPYEQLKPPIRLEFLGAEKSNIDWERLNAKDWMDLTRWKNSLELRENGDQFGLKEPFRKEILENFAKVIDCVGICILHRGLGSNSIGHRSTLREGDEVTTAKDSYLWLYLLDGTIIRLAAETSLSLKELNIGKNENFLHVRVNTGNIFWHSRDQYLYNEENVVRETDVLFLPPKEYEAVVPLPKKNVSEENLYDLVKNEPVAKLQYRRLNRLILENNKWATKPTYSFIVFPSGSLSGRNLNGEIISLTGQKSYVKIKSPQELKKLNMTQLNPITFYFRGFENRETEVLEPGHWYEIDEKGRSLKSLGESNKFFMSELITSSIPTILLTRELYLKKYSLFAHEKLKKKELAVGYGFQQWNGFESETGEKGDFRKRVDFLIEYTRRTETMQLLLAKQLYDNLSETQNVHLSKPYSFRFFSYAAREYYLNYRERLGAVQNKDDELESTKRSFWKKLHGIR